jgi:hypothetical protein
MRERVSRSTISDSPATGDRELGSSAQICSMSTQYLIYRLTEGYYRRYFPSNLFAAVD